MRSILKINSKALEYNFNSIRKYIGNKLIMVVLKANAYGLGLKQLAQYYQKIGAHRIGIAEVQEAENLQNLNIPIQILGSLTLDEIEKAVTYNLVLPITDLKMAQQISQEAKKQKKTIRVHFLIDTGMGQLGIYYKSADNIIKQCLLLDNLKFEGIYTHFSSANESNNPKTLLQIQRFQKILNSIPFQFYLVHSANSDAINNFKTSYDNIVRIGINLYGVYDQSVNQTVPLKPTLSLESQLIAKRTLPKGATIGYGETYTLKKETTVGTIPLGYADGIPLASSNKGFVLIEGFKCSILGQVSMDYIVVDLTPNSNFKIGTLVILIGTSKTQKISIEDWVKIKNTHPYEIICSLGARIKRIFY